MTHSVLAGLAPGGVQKGVRISPNSDSIQRSNMMISRLLFLSLAVLALGVFASGTALAEEKAHEGTVVKVADGKLTMKSGKDEHTHDVGADAKITVDGKAAKLDDLKEGQKVKVTIDGTKVTKVDAGSKK
jgi:hypothetical protein